MVVCSPSPFPAPHPATRSKVSGCTVNQAKACLRPICNWPCIYIASNPKNHHFPILSTHKPPPPLASRTSCQPTTPFLLLGHFCVRVEGQGKGLSSVGGLCSHAILVSQALCVAYRVLLVGCSILQLLSESQTTDVISNVNGSTANQVLALFSVFSLDL
jgi:hypothetical protein